MNEQDNNWWHGSYRHQGSLMAHIFWATDVNAAYDIAYTLKLKDVGHYLYGLPIEMRASRVALEHGLGGEFLHAITYLGFLACHAGLKTGEDLLGDYGLIHQFAHSRHAGLLGESTYYYSIAKGVAELEAILPGLPPDHIQLKTAAVKHPRARPFNVHDYYQIKKGA